jgi:hypothetical protein
MFPVGKSIIFAENIGFFFCSLTYFIILFANIQILDALAGIIAKNERIAFHVGVW